MTVVWLADATDHDRVVFRIGRDGDRLVAQWASLGTLVSNRDGTNWEWREEPGADAALVEKLRTGTMRALLRHLRGELTLHASAVTADESAIAFVGDSGAGKSTLAFELASGSGTFELLSDDCLCLDDQLAIPSEASSWLDQAKGWQKARVAPARIAHAAAPLRAIVHLVYDQEISIRRVRGASAAAILGRSLIRFALDDAEVHRSDLNRLADFSARVDVLQLARPKGFEHMPKTIAAIEELTRELR